MARMHARKKGKSGSHKPAETDLSFVSFSKEEVESLVVKLSKQDFKASMIGTELRDRYGVPSIKKLTGKSVSTILNENGLEQTLPEDLGNLVAKFLRLKKHLENNLRDTHNKRSLILLESRIRRLAKYYKEQGKLAKNWRHD
ncbi:30S ribosomal protein S15 [Candidatus Woesearchaeota archaeon]|nr:30S ribosomal protein S15 [Nanoarchaeota archaeon]MCB9370078.1 30S ribosomal protein S15 [Candidatus Woesearchaeota archaeon]USN44609.1 MAG: 30S ribosomal protein S15 [Candidatus Woesearchaeota archaeon]